jgi:hypothetical protein
MSDVNVINNFIRMFCVFEKAPRLTGLWSRQKWRLIELLTL